MDWKEDQLFEPSVDMMVNDFDDETTLAEEEDLANQEGNEENEVDSLQREGELPIEELLRLYNCPPPPNTHMGRKSAKKARKKRKHIETPFVVNTDQEHSPDAPPVDRKAARLSDEAADCSVTAPPADIDTGPDKGAVEKATPALANNFPPPVAVVDEEAPATATVKVDDDNDDDFNLPVGGGRFSGSATGDDLSCSQPTVAGDEDEDDEEDDDEDEDLDGPSELVHLLDNENDDDDEEEEADYDYYPDDSDLKKSILVGENHQAEIPPATLPRKDSPSPDDELLWSPHSDKVNEGAVERFLNSFYKLRRHLNHPEEQPGVVDPEQFLTGITSTSGGNVKDEECALRKLLEADYNVETALQQVCTLMQANGSVGGGYCGTTPAETWSEEECRNFELGIRLYGKNFTLIQATKVASRSVQELVQFYYFWKKTERYDSFAAKQRLEKKRHSMCNQNPGLTEFMDKFLEEQQQQQQQPTRSISPRQSAVTMMTPPPSSVSSSSSSTLLLAGPQSGAAAAAAAVATGEEHDVDGDEGTEAVAGSKSPTTGASQEIIVEGVGGGGIGGIGVGDGNHSLLIYADSKRHRTSGGGGAAAPTTPPVAPNAMEAGNRHPLELVVGEDTAAES